MTHRGDAVIDLIIAKHLTRGLHVYVACFEEAKQTVLERFPSFHKRYLLHLVSRAA